MDDQDFAAGMVEAGAIHHALENESDRGLALTAHAWLDSGLRGSLLRACKNRDEHVEELFKPESALGSYSGRSRLAYALGLVSLEQFHDLRRIGKIRNLFAHYVTAEGARGPAPITFAGTNSIRDLCGHLTSWKHVFHETDGPREQYSNSVLVLNGIVLPREALGLPDLPDLTGR